MTESQHRIVFVEQFFYPEGWGGAELPRDLTIYLARRGFNVEVICGTNPYTPVEGDPGPDPATYGVRIRRVPRILGGDIHRLKLFRQLWFCAALLPLLLLRQRPGLFVSQTNPPMAVPLIAAVAKLLRRPYLLIAMDVYPEVLEVHRTVQTHGFLSSALRGMFDRAYRTADRVVALGPVMRERLLAKGVESRQLVEISNWSTGAAGVVRGEANSLRKEWGLEEKFVVLYSGNLGIGHEFDTLLRGFAQALSEVPAVRLVVIGSGSRLQEVRRTVAELELSDVVRFSGFVPAARLPESMGVADLAVVTLRPGFEGLIVPSKMLGYMSRGIPMLYVGPYSDVDVILNRCSCGFSVRNGDVDGVCRAIVRASRDATSLVAMGEAGRVGYDHALSREKALEKYEKVIIDCLQSASSKRST